MKRSTAADVVRHRNRFPVFVTLLLLLSSIGDARSIIINWTNTAGGLWSQTNNWSPNTVPATNDDVSITNNGFYNVAMDVSPNVRSLTVGSASGPQLISISNTVNNLTIRNNGNVMAFGVLVFGTGTLRATNTTVRGILSLGGAAINGTITVASNGTAYLSGFGTNVLSGVMTNLGTLFWTAGQIALNSGRIVNQGLFEILSDNSMLKTGTNNVAFTNSGLFRKSGGSFTAISVPFTNSGTITPGSGVLSINGDLTLPASSVLDFPISGLAPGSDFGQLTVSGAFRLGGALNVTFTNGFSPSAGDNFRIIGWGSRSGGFSPENWFNLSNGTFCEDISDASGMTVTTGTTNAPGVTPPTNLVNQVVAVGDSASFFISPNGQPPFAYQWTFNATNTLAGQTNASLLFTNVQFSNAGTYCVVVTDLTFATNTYCATLTVLNPPGFLLQPTSQTVSNGSVVTLTTIASGDGPFRYQWRLNGANILGATNSNYTLSNVRATNGGTYGVVVANPVRVVASSNAILKTFTAALTLADNFAARTNINGYGGVGRGGNLNYTREAGEPFHASKFGSTSGWLRYTAPTNGSATFSTRGSSFDTLLAVYTGTALSNLTVVGFNEDEDGHLHTSSVTFNASAGTSYNIAIDGFIGAQGDIVLSWNLNTNAPPSPEINEHPKDSTAPLGGQATFSVSAVTNVSLGYQWYYNDSLALASATNATLTLSNVGPSNVGYYSVEVTATNGQTVASLRAVLEIGTLTNSQSTDKFWDVLVSQSGGPLFARKGGGPSPLGAFPSVSAGTLGSQTINNFNSKTDQGEPTHSDVITSATRWYKLTADEEGTMVIDTLGSTHINTALSVWTGTDIFSLMNIARDLNSADGAHSRVSFPADVNTAYLVQVDGIDGSQSIINLNWKLGVPPTASSPAQFRPVAEGSTNILSGANSGVPAPNYQWRRNGVDLPGATNSSYLLSNIQYDQGGTYSIVVSNLMGVVNNVIAVVSVQSPLRVKLDGLAIPADVRVWGSATQATVLQLSTNLPVWQPIFTNPNPTLSVIYLDTNYTTRTNAFFKLIPGP